MAVPFSEFHEGLSGVEQYLSSSFIHYFLSLRFRFDDNLIFKKNWLWDLGQPIMAQRPWKRLNFLFGFLRRHDAARVYQFGFGRGIRIQFQFAGRRILSSLLFFYFLCRTFFLNWKPSHPASAVGAATSFSTVQPAIVFFSAHNFLLTNQ